ncbi:hypothetical protein, partial [Salmonella sp. SAL4360]|uniref:hypothetical protein n=1 Tax=Salmonella sp. SAL4360 TaxID=3159881 RepID=UPI00397BC8E7
FNNAGLGIALGALSPPLPNDPGDPDTGPNNRQNKPVLGHAVNGGPGTRVVGTLNSTASTAFTVQFFSNPTADPTGYG